MAKPKQIDIEELLPQADRKAAAANLPHEPRAGNHDAFGRERLDPTPMAPPVGYNPQPSLMDQIRIAVRQENFRRSVEAAGFETFEEGDDFDVPDDVPDPHTPYEAHFDPPPAPKPAPPPIPEGKGGAEAAGSQKDPPAPAPAPPAPKAE